MNWQLVESHQFIVERVIGLRRPRDPEEAQSAGTQALIRAAQSYDEAKGPFENLAYIAVNRAITDLHRQDKRGIYDPGEGCSVEPQQHHRLEHHEAIEKIHDSLRSLGPAKRRMTVLRHGIGSDAHTITQLAHLFERNESVVLSWLRSVEAALAPQLQGILGDSSRH